MRQERKRQGQKGVGSRGTGQFLKDSGPGFLASVVYPVASLALAFGISSWSYYFSVNTDSSIAGRSISLLLSVTTEIWVGFFFHFINLLLDSETSYPQVYQPAPQITVVS